MKKSLFLVLFINILFLSPMCSLSSKSHSKIKAYVMNKIAESLSFSSNLSQSSSNPNSPDYTNRGFKCLEIIIKSTETKAARRMTSSQTNSTEKSDKKSFISTRISNKAIQCLSKDGKTCNKYEKKDSCAQDLSSSSSPEKIITLETTLVDQVAKFYFNRWICPVESGLKTAVNFELDTSGYKISCLGKNGDCYYGDNADIVCRRVNECKEALKTFSTITCGTDEFIKNWDHNGFNTPVNTWCKNASAWLRFDSSVAIAEDKKGYLITNEGVNACIPNPDNNKECLSENDQSILSKTIALYNKDSAKFQNIILCDEKLYAIARVTTNHWCSKSILLPGDKGVFSLTLGNK